MKVDLNKLNSLEKVAIPNTENSKHPAGFFGFFEAKQGYNKLVAYGPLEKDIKLSWIHKEYLTK
jgi:hypothetical protein